MKRFVSRASHAVKDFPGSAAEKATRWGVSKDTVHAWVRGDRAPDEEAEARLSEDGIEPAWWKEPPLEAPPAAAGAGEVPAASPAAISELANSMMRDVADARAAAAVMADAGQRIRALGQAADMVKTLATIKGTLQSERQVRDNPHFVRIVDRLLEALRPHKEAYAAAIKALTPQDEAE